jgi:G3E family GTPase
MDLPLSVYRLKGIFHVDANPDEQLLIQVVGPRISAAVVKPWGEKPRSSEIVAIGLKGSVDQAEMTSLFESCIATQSNGFIKKLTERAQFWRRQPTAHEDTGR